MRENLCQLAIYPTEDQYQEYTTSQETKHQENKQPNQQKMELNKEFLKEEIEMASKHF